jgi:tRNA-specific 2-thiouridylase
MKISNSTQEENLNSGNLEIKDIIDSVIKQIEKDVAHLGKKNSEIRIAVAMSGGVDSSVCPIFFKKAGFEVKGITLKLYENKHEKQGACCSFRDIFDAKRVCAQLGIEHYVINYQEEFKREVIDKFVSDYVSGKTPIPCVQCNQVIKFNYMFELIKDLEFDFLVTGHYVLRKTDENGNPGLFIPDDRAKDQTYFLYNITGQRLKQILFPLGKLSKSQIRRIAEFYSIQTSSKPESQDICFVEGDSYRDFLRESEENKSSVLDQIKLSDLCGDFILNSTGEILGKHNGIQNFTIGQRKGLGISYHCPLYVIKIDEKTKNIFLGQKHELLTEIVNFDQTSWIDENEILEKIQNSLLYKKDLEIHVRLRSMHKNIPALLFFQPETKIFSAKLLEPQYLVCPGQACVIYENERLLGGGTIL